VWFSPALVRAWPSFAALPRAEDRLATAALALKDMLAGRAALDTWTSATTNRPHPSIRHGVVQPTRQCHGPRSPCWLSIAQAASRSLPARLSPVELTRSVLDRLGGHRCARACLRHGMGDRALEAVAEAETAIAGVRTGAAARIPVALKDLYYRPARRPSGVRSPGRFRARSRCNGHRTPARGRRNHRWQDVTHEFATVRTRPSPQPGGTWSATAGGSSAGIRCRGCGGSCLAAMGTDNGGSIRMPASVEVWSVSSQRTDGEPLWRGALELVA